MTDQVTPLSKKNQAAGRMASAVAGDGDVTPEKPKRRAASAGSSAAGAASPDHEPIQQMAIELGIDLIQPGENPRLEVDDKEQQSITDSIKRHGMLQPIRVRPVGDGTFRIVLGYRRFAAAKALGFKKVPVVIGTPTDQDAYVEALVENIERSDLPVLDEARAIKRLLDEGLTQAQLGTRLNRSQSYISNLVRLLDTAPEVQAMLQSRTLTHAAGKAIAGLPEDAQVSLAKRAERDDLTSKDVEEAVRDVKRREADRRREEREAEKYAAFVIESLKGLVKKKQPLADPTTTAVFSDLNARRIFEGENAPEPPIPNPIIAFDYEAHKAHADGFKCECNARLVGFNQYQERVSAVPVCIVAAHYTDWKKARDKKRSDAGKAAAKKLKTIRANVADLFIASEGELSELGFRTLIYTIGRGENQTGQSMVKRWLPKPEGDAVVDSEVQHTPSGYAYYGVNRADLWTAVSAAPMKELVEWLSELLVKRVVPNIYGNAYELNDDVAYRQGLVALGIDGDVVLGGRPVPEKRHELEEGALPSENGVDDHDPEE